jgi:Zn-dependent peptidase ImmA (M78 family)
MNFKINGNTWNITTIPNKQIDEIEGNNGECFIHGTTRYGLNKIFINEDAPEPLRTLKHELIHIWLYEYGHRADEKQYNEEDICEIVASSNNFVNEIVEQYKKKLKGGNI